MRASSPIHRVRNSTIFGDFSFVCARREREEVRPVCNYRDATVRSAVPYSHCSLLLLGLSNKTSGSFSSQLPLVPFQPIQDKSDWNGKFNPVVIRVSGRRTGIRFSAVGPHIERPFSNLCLDLRTFWFLVAHRSNRNQGVLFWALNLLSRTTK